MRQVSIEEFDRNPAAVRDDAQYEPIAVMENSERKLVIMSDEVFRSLYRGSRRVVNIAEMTAEDFRQISESEMPAGFEHLDAELEEGK